MAGLSIALNTGVRSLQVRQKEMATTGQNISNAQKPGYHRRTTQIQSTPEIDSGDVRIGTGVEVQRITRAYDSTLVRNLQQAINKDGYHQRYAEMLENAENILAPEGESSLQKTVTTFADAWQSVATTPDSLENRKTLIENGKRLAEELNLTQSRIQSAKDRIWSGADNSFLSDSVNTANNKATQIAQLNERISQYEMRKFNGQKANDLRDQRDQHIKELARLTDITVNETDDGVKKIKLEGRDWIGSGKTHDTLQVVDNGGTPQLQWKSDGTAIPSQDGGETQGLIESYQTLETLESEFENYAQTLQTELNAQHASGFDLNGDPGGDLFQQTAGEWEFAIDQSDKIAASSVSGASGNGENARALWDKMQDDTVFTGSEDTLTNFVDRRINDVATEVQNARHLAESTESQVQMLEQEIQSMSGVSVDREMQSMLETQRAYQASARFVTVIDEMLASAIRMV
mgnify:CR=1 FL=1